MDTTKYTRVVNKLHRLCTTPILPTAYSDALSYMEQLEQLRTKLNELIERVNELSVEYKEYVDGKVEILQNEIDALETKLDGTLDKVEQMIAGLESYVETAIKDNQSWVSSEINDLRDDMSQMRNDIDADMAQLRKDVAEQIATNEENVANQIAANEKAVQDKIDSLESAVNEAIDNLESIVNAQIKGMYEYIATNNQAIKAWVLEQIEQLKLDVSKYDIKVVNPVTGKVDTLQNTINWLANINRWCGITAGEFDTANITVRYFDWRKVTAFNFDWRARFIFFHDPRFYMRSPFTGARTLIKKVVDALADLHKGDAIKAGEFDALDLGGEKFDGYNVSAYNFDWNAKTILMAE